MDEKLHHTLCPVCNGKLISPLLTINDHTVSKENFVIWQCNNCTLRFTQDAPVETAIGKYYKSPEYISHTNSGKGLLNKIYLRVRNFTLQNKARLVLNTTSATQGKLLDVGCGTGGFLNAMKKEGWTVTGLEPNEEARTLAKKIYDLNVFDSSSINSLLLIHLLPDLGKWSKNYWPVKFLQLAILLTTDHSIPCCLKNNFLVHRLEKVSAFFLPAPM